MDFAFVEMTNGNEAANAIKALHGHELKGRALVVNEAFPRDDRGQKIAGSSGKPSGGFRACREPRN